MFDKVLGLEMGADDFVVKPFDLKELSARVKAVLRRYSLHLQHEVNDDVIRFENFEISQDKFELRLRGKKVDIPPKELQLLYCLASNPNRVFSREQLLEHVWDFAFLGDSRTVDVHIKRLREKLEGVSDKWAESPASFEAGLLLLYKYNYLAAFSARMDSMSWGTTLNRSPQIP